MQEATEWHRVQVWGKAAEHCAKYLKKGSLVFVEGSLKTRKWEDSEGAMRQITEVIAKEVRFLSKAESQPVPVESGRHTCPWDDEPQTSNRISQPSDDDVPF